MKNYIYPLLFIIINTLVLIGCEEKFEPPNTGFSDPVAVKGPSTIEVGNLVSFGDISRGVVSRTWTVPGSAEIINDNGGQSSSLEIIHVKFNKVGIQPIRLQSEFQNDDITIDTTFMVTVLDSIKADIGYALDTTDANAGIFKTTDDPIVLEAGKRVYFAETSAGGPDTRMWEFEGATPEIAGEGEGDTLVSVLYKTPGTYDVMLISSRQNPKGRIDTLTLDDFVTIVPSTGPITVTSAKEDEKGVFAVTFSHYFKPTDIEVSDFSLDVDGTAQELISATLSTEDERIIYITPKEDVKNSAVSITLAYSGSSLESSDDIQLAPFKEVKMTAFTLNLLQTAGLDPSFESNQLTGWKTELQANSGPTSVQGAEFMLALKEDSYQGNGALKVSLNKDADAVVNDFTLFTDGITNPITLAAKTVHKMNYWYKVIGDAEEFTVGIMAEDGTTNIAEATIEGFSGGGSDWQQKELTFETSEEALTTGRISMQFTGKEGVNCDIIIDNIAIFALE